VKPLYATSAELAEKADDEGGIAKLIFGYGLSMEDLPLDLPTHIRGLIRQLLMVKPSLEEVSRYLEKSRDEISHYRDY
jgi:hypothetical protein